MSILSDCSIDRIRSAAAIVYRTVSPTPMLEHPLLSSELGLRAYIKHENHLPTGAFKVRGGLNFMYHYAAEGNPKGVITATRGNHGQSIAFAAQKYGIAATILVPHGNNPEKNESMKAFGASVIEFGADFDEAREEAVRRSAVGGLRYIHSAEEPDLINGVGTYALEMIEADAALKLDVVFVPIGMGSGICGVLTAFRALSPATRIYGVQATGAPSYHLSWAAGRVIETASAATFADGIATRCPSAYTLELIVSEASGVVLVTDDEIRHAVRLLWRTTHNMAEGAAAAAVAGMVKMKSDLKDLSVAAVLSGGNLDTLTLAELF